MNRRGFLKLLAVAPVAVAAVKATPVETAADFTKFGNPIEFVAAPSFDVWTGKHYDYIVSPAQKKALDALRGQYPSMKPVTTDAVGEPLSFGLIDRMEKQARFRR